MSLAALVGGVIGLFVWQAVLSPTILIPIGVLVGIAVSLPIAQKQKL